VVPPATDVVTCECFDGYFGAMCENPPGTIVEQEVLAPGALTTTTRALMMNVEDQRALVGQWSGTGLIAELDAFTFLPLDGGHHLTAIMPLVDLNPGSRVAHARLHFEVAQQNTNSDPLVLEVSAAALARSSGTYDGLAALGRPLSLTMTCRSIDWDVAAYGDSTKTVASADVSTIVEDIVRDSEAYNGDGDSWQKFDSLVFTIKHKEGTGRRRVSTSLIKLTVDFKAPVQLELEQENALLQNVTLPANATDPKYTQRGCPGPAGPVQCAGDELYDFNAG